MRVFFRTHAATITFGAVSMLVLHLSSGRTTVTAQSMGAKQFIQEKHEAASKALALPQSAERKRKLDEVLGGFLDYPTLAERSLGTEWTKRKPQEQKEFLRLLTQLIHRNYEKHLSDTLEYRLTYLGETPATEQGETTVLTRAKSIKKKHAEGIDVNYTVKSSTGGMRVVDIVTDGVSLVRNYRSQFARIIKKEGWSSLIKRMNQRLEKPEEEGI